MNHDNIVSINLGVLDDIMKSANSIYDEIHKTNNILSGLLNYDCINYSNITNTQIDSIINYLITNISEISEISEISDISEKLEYILKYDNLEIFKIKNLLNKEISEYITINEKRMYLQLLENFCDNCTYDKLINYIDNLKNDDVSNKNIIMFGNELKHYKMLNDLDDLDKFDELDKLDKLDKFDKLDLKDIDFNKEILENIVKELCVQNNYVYTILYELKYTLWNESVELYEIIHEDTKEYKYIYFDLYNREDKTEKSNLILLNNTSEKNCIVFNFEDKISNTDLNNFKNILTQILI